MKKKNIYIQEYKNRRKDIYQTGNKESKKKEKLE